MEACKEGVAGSLPRGITLGIQQLCSLSTAISGPIYQMHISELRVHVTCQGTFTKSETEMELHSERGRNTHAHARPSDASVYAASSTAYTSQVRPNIFAVLTRKWPKVVPFLVIKSIINELFNLIVLIPFWNLKTDKLFQNNSHNII